MIVVDTSVWIAARRQARIGDTLDSLIDADEVALALPVRLELLAGVAKHDRRAFLRALSALPQLVPEKRPGGRFPAGSNGPLTRGSVSESGTCSWHRSPRASVGSSGPSIVTSSAWRR